MKNYFKSGSWNIYCDVCNKKIKSGEAKQRWDGFIVCPEDWEPRQPQDFVKARVDKISVPFARPTEQIVFKYPHGVFDTIRFLDTVRVSTNPVKYMSDTLTISETTFKIYKGKIVTESLTFDDTGYLYQYNYTTPAPPDGGTYFAADYVGTLASFT